MSRPTIKILIPRKNDDLLALGRDIKAKHVADGAASLIPPHLADPFVDVYDKANLKHAEQQQLYKDSEKQTEERNQIMGLDDKQDSRTSGTLLFYLSSVRDLLLGAFRGSEKKLGDWGYIVNAPKGKIAVFIPTKPAGITKLSAAIIAKHNDDGAASILPADLMTEFETAFNRADALLLSSAKLRRDAEKATQARNLLVGRAKNQKSDTPNTLLSCILSIRDHLRGLFRGQEQQLGDWGFTVNMSGPATPPPPPAE